MLLYGPQGGHVIDFRYDADGARLKAEGSTGPEFQGYVGGWSCDVQGRSCSLDFGTREQGCTDGRRGCGTFTWSRGDGGFGSWEHWCLISAGRSDALSFYVNGAQPPDWMSGGLDRLPRLRWPIGRPLCLCINGTRVSG